MKDTIETRLGLFFALALLAYNFKSCSEQPGA